MSPESSPTERAWVIVDAMGYEGDTVIAVATSREDAERWITESATYNPRVVREVPLVIFPRRLQEG